MSATILKGLSPRVGMGEGQGSGYKNILNDDSYKHYLAGKGVTIYQPFFKNQTLGHNPLELSLYVPATQGEAGEISDQDFLKRVSKAERKMSKLFGGYTEVSATGGWVNEKGKVIQEPVGKVTSFITPEDYENNRSKFERYVESIRKKYGQTSMSLEFEGDLFFYEPKKKK